MPILEFRCLDCDHIFELISLRSTDTQEMRCPKCEGTEVERVLSRVSHVGRGSTGGQGVEPRVETKSCAGGTCTSINIPGPSR